MLTAESTVLAADPRADIGGMIVEIETRAPRAYIRKALLIAQGANAPPVKQAESDQMVAALHAGGIPVTYVLFPDEGHGFARPGNAIACNALIEDFLAHHLGGEAEPISAEQMAASTAKIIENGEAARRCLPAVTAQPAFVLVAAILWWERQRIRTPPIRYSSVKRLAQ